MLAAASARVLRRQGRLGDALRMLDAGLTRWPDVAALWLERAIAFDLGNSLERAAENYARVRALDPGAAAGWSGGASVAARRGEREAALALGAQALARAPGDPVAAIAVARVEIETGAAGVAAARLEAVLTAPQTAAADRIVAGLSARRCAGGGWRSDGVRPLRPMAMPMQAVRSRSNAPLGADGPQRFGLSSRR